MAMLDELEGLLIRVLCARLAADNQREREAKNCISHGAAPQA
jgi:hypothetical protein